MFITKLIILGLVIFVLSVLEVLFDKVMGIDFSSVSWPKRIAHHVILSLGGAIIAAIVWFV